MRDTFLLAVSVLTICVLAGCDTGPAVAESPRSDTPVAFVSFDSSRLMGSPDPMPLEKERVFPNLTFQRPLELTHANDGSQRLFVVEQRGVIQVFDNKPEVQQSKVFLDIQDVVSRVGNEEGLLGLAFDPKYKENGQLFVYYSTKPRASVVSRFRVSKEDPDRVDRDSEEVLMKIDQPFGNHNGGCIRFGPDGYLYIGLGDGGSAHDPFGNGQNLETLLGSILRIDVNRKDPGLGYAVPKDNPFVERGGSVRGEIWAYGLRNVWRMAFDRKTGELWAGDVGQNRYEEVNRIVRGGNYGWKVREGFHSFDPKATQTGDKLIEPVAEYFHSEGLSVTGGIVYRGKRLPGYRGDYFYADYVSGQVWIARVHQNGTIENRKVAQTGLAISAFGEDADGNMYITAFDGGIYRLRSRKVDLEKTRAAFPKILSETGLFASIKEMKPAAGLIPYDVNFPFWSDGVEKERYIAIPEKGSVQFDESKNWKFPIGTVLVKSFLLKTDSRSQAKPRRLETRLMVHTPEGWRGYTYLWNEEQTEASLLLGASTRKFRIETPDGPVDQAWYFPSRADCMACHTKATGFVLGLNTRQMNRTFDYDGRQANQVAELDRLGVFAGQLPELPSRLEAYPDIASPKITPELFARAYLDVNCAFCHGPGGVAGSRPDLRYHTPLAKMSLLARPPGQGGLGPKGSALVTPGRPELSELLYRISIRGPRQMPPLASNEVDSRAVNMLRQWIKEMSVKSKSP